MMVLHAQQLIKQGLLQVHALQVEHGDATLEIAAIAQLMVQITAIVVKIDLLHDNVLRRSHLGRQIDGNILVAKEAKQMVG